MPPPPQADPEVQTFSLGDWQLQSGEVMPDAYLAYRTYGDPANPLVVYPTWYSGTIKAGNEWLISTPEHPRQALDPKKFFIVCPALFGNGESTSPSNTSGPRGGYRLPRATFYDNVRAQHALVTQRFGKTSAALVVGWSMGGGQTYTWASAFPDFVKLAAPICGSARTSTHNWVFLEAVKAAITHHADWKGGDYTQQPLDALAALGRVYAGWGFSQTFWRENGFERHYGIRGGPERVMVEFWEAWAKSKDANNLLYMLWTWQHGNIGALPPHAGASKLDVPRAQGGRLGTRGDGGETTDEDEEAFKRALKAIRAKVLVMPCDTDLYFPPEDSAIEVATMGNNAELKVIKSSWGHWAGGPGDSKADADFIDAALAELLRQNPSALA